MAGVAMRMASVLLWFSLRKFCVIQLLMALRQVTRLEGESELEGLL